MMMPKKPPEHSETPADPVEVARAIALRRLGRMPQTASQLKTYLLGKSTPVDVAESVVARMADVGLIDDAEYARMWVRSRRLIKNAGDSLLRRELRQRGVAQDLVEDALTSEVADVRALALDLAERRWRALSRLQPEARRKRVVALLIRRGHNPGTAFAVVREVEQTAS